MLTFKTIVSAVAVTAVLLAGLLAYSNWQYSGKLAEQRTLVKAYASEAKAANAASARAELAAQESNAAAAKQTAVAKTHADRARAAEAKLAAVRSAPESTTVAIQAAKSWRQAYESQLEATARLQAAVDTLAPALAREKAASAKLQGASVNLANSTGGSFWKRLVPHVSLSVTAGVNPQGKPDVVAGIGLGYDL